MKFRNAVYMQESNSLYFKVKFQIKLNLLPYLQQNGFQLE